MKQLFRKLEDWLLRRRVRKSVEKNPNFVEDYLDSVPEEPGFRLSVIDGKTGETWGELPSTGNPFRDATNRFFNPTRELRYRNDTNQQENDS